MSGCPECNGKESAVAAKEPSNPHIITKALSQLPEREARLIRYTLNVAVDYT